MLTLINIGRVLLVYRETRFSYFAVGLNDGRIAQKSDILRTIESNVVIVECHSLMNTGTVVVDLIDVKAESLSMRVSENGSVRFCR
jgi:hypothetical protein